MVGPNKKMFVDLFAHIGELNGLLEQYIGTGLNLLSNVVRFPAYICCIGKCFVIDARRLEAN